MRTNNSGILTIILSGFFLLSLSCSPQSCIDETQALLKSSFYKYTTLKTAAPDSLTLHGLEMDSLIYIKSAAVQPGKFPLNPSSDNCKFIVRINGITDTIVFRYSSYPHLVSKECGYTFYHNLDTVPSHTINIIDSISLINSKITTANEENIQYSISLLLLIVCSIAVVRAQDTLIIPLKMRIGLDAYGPITYLSDKNIFQTEGYFSLDLNEKRSVVINAGFLNYKHSQSDFNYRYDFINKGVFIKTGLDFNLLKPEKAMGKYWAGIGLRYGLSVYNSEIPNIERLNYWGNGTASVPPKTSMGHFIEASPGVRAEVIRNISIGWTISLRKLISSGPGKGLKPIYLPGYGNTGKSISTGINYFIVWNIPYKKIRVITKKEETEEDNDTDGTDTSEGNEDSMD